MRNNSEPTPSPKGRITGKVFTKWVNDEFKRVGIDNVEAYETVRTRFRGEDYEAGAAFLYVRFRLKEDPQTTGIFLCFYPFYEYERLIKIGYKMVLKFENNRFGFQDSIENLTVDLEK
ncbi:hypothetical protein FKG96_09985 [Olivibacter sp. LS-1]|uniref:hypothetical protein n=1 Tax=Olivibacter sp. LS-1 TaxID=2592345 RepID=UPI0011EABA09|nr:hypothetical protein [Olivibacter sp. LS-1]QEL01123.1 hypothetical protein FKG96_09985 [Olivibacter sp. LS-1]